MTVFGRGLGTGGCKRCSLCSIHYPPHSKHDNCEVCGEATSFFNNVEPDPEWQEAVKYAKMHPPERDTSARLHTHRFEQYLRMGFTEHQAQKLALSTYGSYEMPLYWGIVQQALDAGCEHHLAFDMFT